MPGIADLYKKIPTNMRLFAEYMLGADSPITEEDFTEEELGLMRQHIALRQQRLNERESLIREWHNQAMSADNEWDRVKYDPETDKFTYEKYQDYGPQEFEKKIKDIQARRKRPDVQYEDYDPLWDGRYNRRNENSLIRSFTDPKYNVGTSLGRYVADIDDKGNATVKDTYDWNPVKGLDPKDPVNVLRALMHAEGAREYGNVIARVLRGSGSRDVEIQLGQLEQMMEQQNGN